MTTCTLLRTLHDYWAQTGLPCWLEGHTHQSPEAPYLLYTAGRGDFGEMTHISATAWFAGQDAAAQRADAINRIETMLPPLGARLFPDGGMMLIDRDQEQFIEMIGNKTDPALLGLRVRAMLRVYG